MSDRSVTGTAAGIIGFAGVFSFLQYLAIALMLGAAGVVVLIAIAVVGIIVLITGLLYAAAYNHVGLKNFVICLGTILLGFLPGIIGGHAGIHAVEDFINGSVLGQIYCFFFWGIAGIFGAPVVLFFLALMPWEKQDLYAKRNKVRSFSSSNSMIDDLPVQIWCIIPIIVFFPWGFALGSHLYGAG